MRDCGPVWPHPALMSGPTAMAAGWRVATANIRHFDRIPGVDVMSLQIEITHHHERVALLTPARLDRIDQLHDASDIAPGKPLDRPIRRYPPAGQMTASEALEEDLRS
jgi:hypothetical protein